MDKARRKDLHCFLENIAGKADRFRIRIEDVAALAPVGAHTQLPFGIIPEFRIRRNSALHVPRHIDFGDDFDMTAGGKRDNFAQLLLRVESAVRHMVETHGLIRVMARNRLRTDRADFGQLRIAFDFNTPPLIICEMQMEAVQAVQCQKIDETTHLFDREKVPGCIQQESAPAVFRSIRDPAAGQNRIRHEKLTERLYRPRQSGGGGGFHTHPAFADFDRVTLFGEPGIIGRIFPLLGKCHKSIARRNNLRRFSEEGSQIFAQQSGGTVCAL